MSYVLVKRGRPAVYCPHCATPNVKKNGVKANGRQNFYCKDCRRQFQFEYIYPGADPRIKRKVCEMAMNGSGIRDTAASAVRQSAENKRNDCDSGFAPVVQDAWGARFFGQLSERDDRRDVDVGW